MKLPTQKAQQGFTLIELMIVVAIIGILASIALPAYQNYMIKSKLVEATTDLDAAKIAVTEAYANGVTANTFPAASPIAALGLNAKFVDAIQYNKSTDTLASIVVTLGDTGNTAIDGKFLGLIGVGKTDGTVEWTCATMATVSAVAAGGVTAMYPYLPANCQS
jgi:type IV pilus assembly protein PilA